MFVVCVYVAQNGGPVWPFKARRQLSALHVFRGRISLTASSSASGLARRFMGRRVEVGGLPGRNSVDVLIGDQQ